MITTSEIILVLGMMVVTFSIRYILLAFSGRFVLPKTVENALNYVPPAVLTAIIVPAVLIQEDQWNLSIHNAYLAAAISAVIAGFLFPEKVLAASITTGLVVFAIFRIFF